MHRSHATDVCGVGRTQFPGPAKALQKIAGFDFAIAAVRSIHVYQHYDVPGSNDIKAKVPVWQIVVVLAVSWLGALSEIFGALLGYKVLAQR